jgi:hemerythrin superfamily protein
MAEDAITLITRDHREMEQLFEQLRTEKEDRPALLEQVGAMLLAHSRAEEEKVYPELTAASPGEKEEVHHGAQEHAEAEQILHRLERTDPKSSEFDKVLSELVDAVSHHIEEEESEILPSLEETLGQAKLEELGRAFMERREQELALHGIGGAAGAEGAFRYVGLPETAASSGGSGGPKSGGSKGAAAEDMTKDELYEKAREAGIEGRSTMNKDELAEAVQQKS